MPESSNPKDSPLDSYRSRMSSLGLEATPRRQTPRRGKHVVVGVVVGVLTYLVLAVLLNVLIGGLVGSALMLVALVVSVVVGVRAYRTLQQCAVMTGDEDE